MMTVFTLILPTGGRGPTLLSLRDDAKRRRPEQQAAPPQPRQAGSSLSIQSHTHHPPPRDEIVVVVVVVVAVVVVVVVVVGYPPRVRFRALQRPLRRVLLPAPKPRRCVINGEVR